jgi:glycosyltransferase involved in cell wall biosynthesis
MTILPTPLPFVSICLLTYKRAAVLSRTLDLLLAQTHRDFELIINDDCSPDDTERVAREYERKDARVRYCRNERNMRFAGNQTLAIQRARSEYVALVHDGDIYRADMIEKWTQAMVEHPTGVLVFNATQVLNDKNEVIREHYHPYEACNPGRLMVDLILRQIGSPIFGIVMVRRSAVLAAGEFDQRIPTLADVDMWLRLLLHGDFLYVREPLYSIYPREMDHHNQVGNWGIVRQNELIIRLNLRRRHPESTPEAEQVRKAAERSLWKIRLVWLGSCLKHRRFNKLIEGLKLCMERPIPNPWRKVSP